MAMLHTTLPAFKCKVLHTNNTYGTNKRLDRISNNLTAQKQRHSSQYHSMMMRQQQKQKGQIYEMVIPSIDTNQFLNNKDSKKLNRKGYENIKKQMKKKVKKTNTQTQRLSRYSVIQSDEVSNLPDTQTKIRATNQIISNDQKIKLYYNQMLLEYMKNNPEIQRYFKNQLLTKPDKSLTRQIQQICQYDKQKFNMNSNPIFDQRILRTRLNRQNRIRAFKRHIQTNEKNQINAANNHLNRYFQTKSIELKQWRTQRKQSNEHLIANDIKNYFNLKSESNNNKINNPLQSIETNMPTVFIMTPKILPTINSNFIYQKKLTPIQKKNIKIPVNESVKEFKISGWQTQKVQSFYNPY